MAPMIGLNSLASGRYLENLENSYMGVSIDISSFEPRTLSLFYARYNIYVVSENGAPFREVVFEQNPYGTLPFVSIQDDVPLGGDLFLPRQVSYPPHIERRDLSKGQPPLEWRVEQDYWLNLSGLKIAGPWDSYRLYVLIAFNRTMNLGTGVTQNELDCNVPQTVKSLWDVNQELKRLAQEPDNRTLTEYGINPAEFHYWDSINMTDFYLYTMTIEAPFITKIRMVLAFLAPSFLLLILMIVAALRINWLTKSEVLTLFLGIAFFMMSTVIAFYQVAPPRAIAIQEVLFLVFFVTAVVITIYRIRKPW